ncbi:MAG TPA: Clp protease N-terminal domain-containing protein, partial [Rugosimonospora sp.]|nr:Clp protease N-terminal domain-containing protein [Rugosimonospora sp.]
MAELPALSALIEIVDGRAGGRTTLDRITVAEELTADLRSLGDRLIGYYVELARSEGYSWTDIGGHLGVSRQAAQQRYTPRWSSLTLADLSYAGAFTRLTRRCKDALARAEEHARRLRHDSVGTEHLLLGILDDTGTVAGAALLA